MTRTPSDQDPFASIQIPVSRCFPELKKTILEFPKQFRSQNLWLRSRSPGSILFEHWTLAVVGTRTPSLYGVQVVHRLMDALKGLPMNILSGGALGIDGEAHRAAIRNHLATQAIVVGPVNSPNPRSHRNLYHDIENSRGGAILVPQHLEPVDDSSPQKHWWLDRNQWIAASANAVLVVEAAQPSGTLSTVHHAHDFHKPIWIVPGSIFSKMSEGNHQMLSDQKGQIVTQFEALVKEICSHVTSTLGRQPHQKIFAPIEYGVRDRIMGVVRQSSFGLDPGKIHDLCLEWHIDYGEMVDVLSDLIASGELTLQSGFYNLPSGYECEKPWDGTII